MSVSVGMRVLRGNKWANPAYVGHLATVAWITTDQILVEWDSPPPVEGASCQIMYGALSFLQRFSIVDDQVDEWEGELELL